MVMLIGLCAGGANRLVHGGAPAAHGPAPLSVRQLATEARLHGKAGREGHAALLPSYHPSPLTLLCAAMHVCERQSPAGKQPNNAISGGGSNRGSLLMRQGSTPQAGSSTGGATAGGLEGDDVPKRFAQVRTRRGRLDGWMNEALSYGWLAVLTSRGGACVCAWLDDGQSGDLQRVQLLPPGAQAPYQQPGPLRGRLPHAFRGQVPG